MSNENREKIEVFIKEIEELNKQPEGVPEEAIKNVKFRLHILKNMVSDSKAIRENLAPTLSREQKNIRERMIGGLYFLMGEAMLAKLNLIGNGKISSRQISSSGA